MKPGYQARGRRGNQGADLQIAAVVCPHLFRGEGIVENFALYVAIGFALVGKHFEEGGASSFWTAEDNCWAGFRPIPKQYSRTGRLTKHFARSDNTIESGQNIACFGS